MASDTSPFGRGTTPVQGSYARRPVHLWGHYTISTGSTGAISLSGATGTKNLGSTTTVNSGMTVLPVATGATGTYTIQAQHPYRAVQFAAVTEALNIGVSGPVPTAVGMNPKIRTQVIGATSGVNASFTFTRADGQSAWPATGSQFFVHMVFGQGGE